MFYKHMSVLVVEGQTDTYEHHTIFCEMQE